MSKRAWINLICIIIVALGIGAAYYGFANVVEDYYKADLRMEDAKAIIRVFKWFSLVCTILFVSLVFRYAHCKVQDNCLAINNAETWHSKVWIFFVAGFFINFILLVAFFFFAQIKGFLGLDITKTKEFVEHFANEAFKAGSILGIMDISVFPLVDLFIDVLLIYVVTIIIFWFWHK